MKQLIKMLFYGVLAIAGLAAAGCSDSDDASKGGIHGVAIDAENQEPMRGVNVQLCKQSGTILESTVTYDDGHFEFTNVDPGDYSVIIASTKYPNVKYDFSVQSGRTASFDVPMGLHVNPYMPIYITVDFQGSGSYAEIKMTIKNNTNVKYIDEGVYYSVNDNPMSSGEKCTMVSLLYGVNYNFRFYISDPTTMYYVQGYLKDDKGNTYLSEIIHVVKQPASPEVQTVAINKVNDSKAICEGKIIHRGNPVYTERGFIISTEHTNPTITDVNNAETKKYPVEGTEETFKYHFTDIEPDTKYYIRAYAINEVGIAYGDTEMYDGLDWYVQGNLMVQKTDLATSATWDTAVQLCKDSRVGGYSDWRLPTLEEALIIASKYWFTLPEDERYFNYYWTQTPYNPDDYTVSYNVLKTRYNGSYVTDYYFKTCAYRVRAVRTMN